MSSWLYFSTSSGSFPLHQFLTVLLKSVVVVVGLSAFDVVGVIMFPFTGLFVCFFQTRGLVPLCETGSNPCSVDDNSDHSFLSINTVVRGQAFCL